MKTTEYILKNGLRVMHNQKGDSKMVDVRIKLGAGNFYNSYNGYTPGIAHFVEHVVHEKTEKYKSKEELTSIVTDLGGSRNASTSPNEMMTFFATVLKEYSESACDFISQVVFYSEFDQDAVDKHKKIIKEELLSYLKAPSKKSWDLFKSLAYEGTNFVSDTLGTEESIESMQLSELREYYKERFTLQNSILVVSGDISLRECKKVVDKYFSKIKQNKNSTNFVENIDVIPKIDNKRQGCVLITDKQAVVNFGTILGGFDKKEFFSTLVLLKFLTATSNSILSKKLREENHLVYGISSNIFGNQLSSIAYFNLNVQPENIQQCLDIIRHEISEVALGKITEEDLNKTRKRIEAFEIFNNQSIQDESNYNSSIRLLYRDIKNRDEYVQKILDVSLEDVKGAAKWLYENLNILAVCSNVENKYNF